MTGSSAEDKPTPAEPGDEARNAVRRLLQEGKRRRIGFYYGAACWSAAMILLIAAIRIAPQQLLQSLGLLLTALCCLVAGAALALPHGRTDTSAAALSLLAQRPLAETVGAIGALIDALDLPLDAQRSAIRALLTVLLPRLTPADAHALSGRQRSRLQDTLLLGDADREAEYLLAILQGLEQVGDEEALRAIRCLAQRGAVTVAQRRVLEAAAACLLSLETRLEQERNRDVLLRGAAPGTSTGELLCPAGSEPDPHPETLLRLPNDTNP